MDITVMFNSSAVKRWLRNTGTTRKDLGRKSGLSDCMLKRLLAADAVANVRFDSVWRIHKATGLPYDVLMRAEYR